MITPIELRKIYLENDKQLTTKGLERASKDLAFKIAQGETLSKIWGIDAILKECANKLKTECTLGDDRDGYCKQLTTNELTNLDIYYNNLGFSTELVLLRYGAKLKISGWAK